MTDETMASTSSITGKGNSAAPAPLDAMAIELATGLSIADMEALKSGPSPELRAEVAIKFAREFDRIAKGPANRLTADLLSTFSNDQDRLVRMRFAESIKTSSFLPPDIARCLARDEIDVADPILRESPMLDDATLGEIVVSMPERYALVIADRRPLSGEVVSLLIEHKGTRRIAARLIDNSDADLSETVLQDFRDWGRSDPDLAERLEKRPNLPFAFVSQSVADLADSVRWSSLGERLMTKSEATMLQSRFEGKTGHRCSSKGERFRRLQRGLRDEFEKGLLKPSTLLGFLHDRDIDRLECGFSIIAALDLRWVRKLLYNSDRRGLVALCLKAEFSTADYLVFRMAFSLAELGTVREKPEQQYPEKFMKFARDQYEKLRADRYQLKCLLPPDAT